MNKRIVVIGAGIIGLSAARELARRGARVEVLERGEPGREASWAGAGILSLLPPWEYAAAVAELAEYSQARYPDWIESVRGNGPVDPEYRRSGMLVLEPYDTAKAEAWLARRPSSSPAPAPKEFGHGLWLPKVAQVRNPRLLQALLENLRRLAVPIRTGLGKVGLSTSAGRVAAAVSGRRQWTADLFVVAAGAWSAELLGDQAAGLPIRPVRGQILLYRAEPGRLPCILYRDGQYLVPRTDGLILAGSTLEDVGFDQRTTTEAHDRLHAFVRSTLPDVAAAGPVRHWAGLRPGSPGNVPIIARHPALDNLFVDGGHFRYGVTMAPASAELLADLIENKPPALTPRSYQWPDIMRAAPV